MSSQEEYSTSHGFTVSNFFPNKFEVYCFNFCYEYFNFWAHLHENEDKISWYKIVFL